MNNYIICTYLTIIKEYNVISKRFNPIQVRWLRCDDHSFQREEARNHRGGPLREDRISRKAVDSYQHWYSHIDEGIGEKDVGSQDGYESQQDS